MMSRLSINYKKNDIASMVLCGDLVDMHLGCRMEKGETFFFTAHGFEWMGECTEVHHLFGELIPYGNNHLPMFKLTAHAVRKLPT